MRYIKPDYYDEFACIADRCPDTCCAGWQIMIDEDSLEKYERVKGSFGERLKREIDWEEGAFCQKKGRCCFLNEKNLCDIYGNLGEEALCETCTKYPRHVEEFEDLREYSLSLSCPVAARMMLTRKMPVSFLVTEDEKADELEEEFEDFDLLLFTDLEDAREAILAVLQNRQLSVKQRITLVKELAIALQRCVDEERWCDMQDKIEGLEVWKGREQNREKKEEEIQEQIEIAELAGEKEDWKTENHKQRKMQKQTQKQTEHRQRGQIGGTQEQAYGAEESVQDRYLRKCREFAQLNSLEHLREEWEDTLKATWVTLYEQGADAYEAVYEGFHSCFGERAAQAERYRFWEGLGEQLMVFFVFTYFCGAVYDNCIYSKIALAEFCTDWIEEIIMARWMEDVREEKNDRMKKQEISQEAEKTKVAESFLKDGSQKKEAMAEAEGAWQEEFKELCIRTAWQLAREVEHSDENLIALEEYFMKEFEQL